MIKGYVLNKEVLENGGVLGKDYFDELLEEIKDREQANAGHIKR